jgi:hypothetical protein
LNSSRSYASTVYEPGQALNYGGSSYVSLTQNVNVNPATDNGTNWEVVAAASVTARPQNGIFAEISITSGTLAGLLVYASGGSYTTYSFTMPSISSGGTFGAFELVSDYEQLRWFLYYKGALVQFTNTALPAYAKFAALPANVTIRNARL